ncbi:hypothetical protein B7C42_01646 [Nocardia cerradoensis]|uniref:HK97 gp10 family phage protein n=1 Tax=Nocardia cerradoensis TaxID=85688 RepID=A0A231HCN6_9NOCA|nr:hypothetical protein [Nocardia cerradoensis]OXR46671.1 hypothetical protein B7C42_01646 [Nocardia cerradoensis]
MEIMGVIAELTKLSAAAGASPQARAECERLAKKGEQYAKTIAPVNKTGRPHRLPSGYVDNPGDYRDSIRGETLFKNGKWRGRVGAYDYKSHWIEYGTSKMPKQSIMRRTAGHLRGSSS